MSFFIGRLSLGIYWGAGPMSKPAHARTPAGEVGEVEALLPGEEVAEVACPAWPEEVAGRVPYRDVGADQVCPWAADQAAEVVGSHPWQRLWPWTGDPCHCRPA